MSAYFIARVQVTDREKYRQYLDVVPGIIARHGGRVVARSVQGLTLEGKEEKRRIIVIEFPSVADAAKFYHSDEYLQARQLRQDAAVGEIVVVDGI